MQLKQSENLESNSMANMQTTDKCTCKHFPLTDEDVERIVREARVGEHGIGYTIARAIEAAHGIKEKNNV